jgi:hypothetical protein
MPHKDIEKRREYQRNYWRKRNKGVVTRLPNANFDQFPYRVVPDTWRARVKARDAYNTVGVHSPILKDLIEGKTVFVDYQMPLGQKDNPFRTLYGFFNARGYRLHIHVLDDVVKAEYRRVLIWADPPMEARKSKSA